MHFREWGPGPSFVFAAFNFLHFVKREANCEVNREAFGDGEATRMDHADGPYLSRT